MQSFQSCFQLDWEQINEVYNHLTEDADKELSVEAFENLIKCLWYNKNLTEAENKHLRLTPKEFELLIQNADKISEMDSFEEFGAFLGQNIKTKSETDFCETKMLKLFEKIKLYKKTSKKVGEFFERIQNLEPSEIQEERELELVSDENQREDYVCLENKQISRFRKLLSFCVETKKMDPSPKVSKLVFEVMSFGEHMHQNLEMTSEIIKNKTEYLETLENKMANYQSELIQTHNKIEALVYELSNEKSLTKELKKELEDLRETDRRTEETLKQEIRSLETQNSGLVKTINEFEEHLSRKQSDLELMSTTKDNLNEHVSSLQKNLDRYSELVRETSICGINKKESETVSLLENQVKELKNQISKLQKNNNQLEDKLNVFRDEEVVLQSKVAMLSQQTLQFERILSNINKGPNSMQLLITESDQMDLNLDKYGGSMCELQSRRISSNSVHKKEGFSKADIEFEEMRRQLIQEHEESKREKSLAFPEPCKSFGSERELNLEECCTEIYPQISLILNNKENEETESNSVYAEFVYICQEKLKLARFLVVENGKIVIYKNRSVQKPERQICLRDISSVVLSIDNHNIFELLIENTSTKKESLIFENYSTEAFLDFINKQTEFNKNIQRKGEIFLTTISQFKNAICNVYKSVKKAGFLELLDPENSWGNWKWVFVIRLENVITVSPVLEKYHYDNFEGYRKNAQLILLDNYNVFKNGRKTGYLKENLFYVKIRNENRNLIFSSASIGEKKAWIKALSE